MLTAPLLVLVGPTASGKSAAALAAADALGAEIVAADAFTVYRGMDVGTAKPTPAERARVRHHMIDVLDPSQESTVAWFQVAARAAVDDVRRRGRRPLLVGGSGLYVRAVIDDLEFPPTDTDARAAVRDRVGGDPQAAHAELRARDPEAARRIDPQNLRRSVRALEVLDLTGRPFSDWRTAWDDYTAREPVVVLGVDVDRSDLDERIRRRTRRMLDAGLLEEAADLARGPLSRTARRAIGYAECFAHLSAGRRDEGPLEEAISRRTRRYAVRQQRWFRADPRVRWVRPDAAASALVAAAGRGGSAA